MRTESKKKQTSWSAGKRVWPGRHFLSFSIWLIERMVQLFCWTNHRAQNPITFETQLEIAPKSKCVITSSSGVEVHSMSIFLRHVVKVDVLRASTVLQPFIHCNPPSAVIKHFWDLVFPFDVSWINSFSWWYFSQMSNRSEEALWLKRRTLS